MNGASSMIQTLRRLSDLIKNPEPVFRRVVLPFRKRAYQQAFDTAGASTGSLWAALEPSYAAIQRRTGDSTTPLETSRNPLLEPSFQGGSNHVLRVSRNAIEVGSRVPWATHVATGGTNPLTGETFPARDPRPLTRSQIADLSEQVMRFMTLEALR